MICKETSPTEVITAFKELMPEQLVSWVAVIMVVHLSGIVELCPAYLRRNMLFT